MLPGLSRPYSYHLWKVAVQGYGGMLCRAATRPSTVYGGMPVGLFGHPESYPDTHLFEILCPPE